MKKVISIIIKISRDETENYVTLDEKKLNINKSGDLN
jgi:hypothetical protein